MNVKGWLPPVKKATSLMEKICGGREENQACRAWGFVHLYSLPGRALAALVSVHTGYWTLLIKGLL